VVTDCESSELHTGCESGKLEKLPPRRRQRGSYNIISRRDDTLDEGVCRSDVGVFFENSIVCRWIVSANLGAVCLSR
jgi:hypothetical protein